MEHRQGLIFRHVDFVQHAEAAGLGAGIHRPGSELHLTVPESIRAHQRPGIGVHMQGNVPHGPLKQSRQILGQHVFARGLAARQQQVLPGQHRSEHLLPDLNAVVGIPGNGNPLRTCHGMGLPVFPGQIQNLRVYPLLLQKRQNAGADFFMCLQGSSPPFCVSYNVFSGNSI